MKSNQIVKFIHLLQVFISIQLLIKVGGERMFGVIKGAKLKGRNYFTKILLSKKSSIKQKLFHEGIYFVILCVCNT